VCARARARAHARQMSKCLNEYAFTLINVQTVVLV